MSRGKRKMKTKKENRELSTATILLIIAILDLIESIIDKFF